MSKPKLEASYLDAVREIKKRVDVAATIEDLDKVTSDFAKLTKTQRSRALATVAGKTPTEIAKAEGVSKQSVSETLNSAMVKATIRELVRGCTIEESRKNERGEPTLLKRTTAVEAALSTIMNLMDAKKPVIFGSTYQMVPDNATRFQAALKIIEWAQESQGPAEPPKPAVSEDLAIEESTTSTRRLARRQVS
jgi:hypothetical protein